MEFKNYAEVLALQSQFTSRFEKRLAELRKELPKSMEAVIGSKRAGVKSALESMKAAEKTRDSLVKRANAEIAHHKDTAARLTREIEELEKSAKGGKAAKPAKTEEMPAVKSAAKQAAKKK